MHIQAHADEARNKSMSVQNRRIARRLIRNLVVTLAVTAIFGFKAADLNASRQDPELMTLAAAR